MIHSLSGGVIAENGIYTFAKVELDGSPFWYLAPSGVNKGDRVLVPFGKRLCEGVVLRTEVCSSQCAPVPMNRVGRIEKILARSDGKPLTNETTYDKLDL